MFFNFFIKLLIKKTIFYHVRTKIIAKIIGFFVIWGQGQVINIYFNLKRD